MNEIKLSPCYVGGVKADLVKGTVRLTFDVKLTPELQDAVRMKLAWWSVAEMPIDLRLKEWQEELPGLEPAEVTA